MDLVRNQFSFWHGARGQIDYMAFMMDPDAWSYTASDQIERTFSMKATEDYRSPGYQYLKRRAKSFDLAIQAMHGMELYNSHYVCRHPVFEEAYAGTGALPGPRCPLCGKVEALMLSKNGDVLRYRPPSS